MSDFEEAIKAAFETVKNVLQQIAQSFSDLVETLAGDTVYYEYVHSSVQKGRHKATAVINRGGIFNETEKHVISRPIQPKDLHTPTFNTQS